MRLSAIDCLRRGLASSGANWELVIVQWLHGFALTVLVVVGSALPFAALGYNLATANAAGAAGASGLSGIPEDLDQTRSDLLLRVQGRLLVLGAALLGMLVLWLLAVLLHAWVQAGTYGVLHSADRQAPPGEGRGIRAFRTFAWRNFFGWAGLYGRRYFSFANLAGLFLLVWTLAVPLWMAATLGGAARWGEGGALGIGCGGALPLGFVLLVLLLWYAVAQADLAREGSDLRAASRIALEVLGARLGAVLLLVVLFFLSLLLLAAIGLAVQAASLLLAGWPLLRALAEIGFTLIASLTQGLLLIALGGTLVALVRSETARGTGSPLVT
jgi:hypothetical protein